MFDSMMYIEVKVGGETFGYRAVRDHKTGKPKLNSLGSNSTIWKWQDYKTSNGRLMRRRIRAKKGNHSYACCEKAFLDKYRVGA